MTLSIVGAYPAPAPSPSARHGGAYGRAWRFMAAATSQMETEMTRALTIFAAAAALAGTLIASATPSLAQERGSRWTTQQNWYGPGEYDRRVNGSDASTPGHN
jgi:hypothetical protein